MYLENINGPEDIKKISVDDLQILADETRSALINRISKIGGHKGPNLGVVELSVALHYCFNSPTDKFVWDVSHQSYPHKILTGRKLAYLDDEHFGDVTGYTNPKESPHDFFKIGHTSTSISLALGLAKGRDVNGGKENIIAIIGDGSLSGGEALEALDYAGEYDKNFIIIVNDNDQSIAENHGGIYKTLKALRDSNGTAPNNFFKGFGLDYMYVENGHDIKTLVNVFSEIKDIDHPIVVHIHTIKGKGLKYAEENRESWHAGGPFNVEDGSPKIVSNGGDTTVFDSLINLLETDDTSVILNAGTPMGLGFVGDIRQKWASLGRFVDVGIAEENAMAMASGIAKNGGTPVFGTFAPFLQRTYDQLSHDLCLNDNPATILVLSPGVYGMNSDTHIALSDIQFFAHVPNLIYLAPTSKEEYQQMFKFATTNKKHPVAIRVPNSFTSTGVADTTDYSLLNKSLVVNEGCDTAIIAVGPLLSIALDTAKAYKEKTGKDITVINPRFLTGIDTDLLESLKKNHSQVITIEDGYVDGGYGQRIASYYGTSDMKVTNLGLTKEFHTDYDADELLSSCGISLEGLLARCI
ncbi:1-deoxy-D-xylulose-5-phosphate synthase [Lachnospira multipara]|uniref:1-deoxy-D-xylulose-5-phosphate synthase n=1 Tax=Lachnospira multipara TaxID=28051 RepID=UPI0004E21A5D|nr:1-deoxy-D-xylulose-5-phosphate synthase [Lachnospira multipara]